MMTETQELKTDSSENDSKFKTIPVNGVDHTDTLSTEQLLDSIFTGAYHVQIGAPYERSGISSSRANSAEACQSSSLTMDKSLGSNRSKRRTSLVSDIGNCPTLFSFPNAILFCLGLTHF